MTNYQYIFDLFKEVLTQSRAIQGRFHIGWRYGLQDMNYDRLGEVISEFAGTAKYPLVYMAPPHSTAVYAGKNEGWEEFRIILFFMTQSLVQNLNQRTKTSEHSIPKDWHDMKRCAINFLKALQSIQYNTPNPLFILPTHQALFIPISGVGADRVSGIRLDFDFKVYAGCDIEDYDAYPITTLILPDGHPEHNTNQ